jgi:transposase
MDVLHARCAGLDVHKRTVVACRLVSGEAGGVDARVARFGTTSAELERLADWLDEAAVSHVGMESTGVYWQPIWNVLEERGFALVLANARHMRAVPGRKTDVRDCQWIAELLRHGLLPASFVPAREQRQRRALERYRTELVRERSAEANRLQKTLEGANIKLASVASDVLGKSGRAMPEALVRGHTQPELLASLAQGRLRDKQAELEQALRGRFGPHERFLVAQQLRHIDMLDELIERVSAELAAQLRPFDEALARLDSIPGVGRRTAEVLLAELGPDLGRFGSPARLASWAALCPGNRESAGKQRSGRTRQGNRAIRAALCEAAKAAGRTRTALGERYRRLARRIGANKAALAVAHAILRLAYALLTRRQSYQEPPEPPAPAVPPRRRAATIRYHLRRLQQLGACVDATAVALPSPPPPPTPAARMAT